MKERSKLFLLLIFYLPVWIVCPITILLYITLYKLNDFKTYFKAVMFAILLPAGAHVYMRDIKPLYLLLLLIYYWMLIDASNFFDTNPIFSLMLFFLGWVLSSIKYVGFSKKSQLLKKLIFNLQNNELQTGIVPTIFAMPEVIYNNQEFFKQLLKNTKARFFYPTIYIQYSDSIKEQDGGKWINKVTNIILEFQDMNRAITEPIDIHSTWEYSKGNAQYDLLYTEVMMKGVSQAHSKYNITFITNDKTEAFIMEGKSNTFLLEKVVGS